MGQRSEWIVNGLEDMHAIQFLRVRIDGNCFADCGPKDGRFIAPLMHGNLSLHNLTMPHENLMMPHSGRDC
jgi:hypothetical protein